MAEAITLREVERQLLLEVIDCAFAKASWHGPNLTGAVRGVDAGLAGRRLPGRKSIWEQVLHAAYWKQRVINKLATPGRLPRRGSNWPLVPDEISPKAWRDDVALLQDVHRQLRHAIASLPADRLDAKAKRLIHGVAFHDIYHAGQIRLLRKMMGT